LPCLSLAAVSVFAAFWSHLSSVANGSQTQNRLVMVWWYLIAGALFAITMLVAAGAPSTSWKGERVYRRGPQKSMPPRIGSRSCTSARAV